MMLLYDNRPKKRNARAIILPVKGYSTIVGLPGPNIMEYIEDCLKRGFKKMLFWEFDLATYIGQKSKTLPPFVQLNYGDIIEAPVEEDVFYDLDFCWTTKHTRPYIERFKKNYAITVAMRCRNGNCKEDVVIELIDQAGAKIFRISHFSKNETIISTNKGHFHAYSYRDGMPMLTIRKL